MNSSISILFFIVLLAVYIRAEFDTRGGVSSLSARARDALPYRFVAPGRTARTLPSSAVDGLDIVDVVILASVDGKLHALNRTTGLPLWSMGDDPDSAQSPPTTFDSLVRTQHSSHEESDQELFIIEPQSGDIYVLPPTASPSDKLQRLPFSMPQLVEMSPFTFPGDEQRMFVGSKETSMVVVELDTGRVKGTINADKECFWNDDVLTEDIDLDELDGTKPPRHKLQSREIHIGRTDYHVRVHTRHQGVVQNLVFSSYGPNNIDREKQSQWKRTPDDLYVQPLSNGQILAFQIDGMEDAQHVSNDGMPIWGQSFSEPIVAVFDVLMTPARTNPLALLQPRPQLEQLFPRRTTSKNMHVHNLPEATFVGLVGDSLYAMSHEHFPLVVFDREPPRVPPKGIEQASGTATDVCEGLQCLVGSRLFESSSQWYIPPLLDSVPHVQGMQELVSLKHQIDSSPANTDVETNDSRTSVRPAIGERLGEAHFGTWTWGACGALFLSLLVARSLFAKRRIQASSTREVAEKKLPNPPIQDDIISTTLPTTPSPVPLPLEAPPETDPVAAPEMILEPSTPKSEPSAIPLPTPPTDTPGDAEEGDESEKEGPLDAPRRKGPRRRKRGKKKKNENQGPGADAEDDEAPLPEVREIVAEPPAQLVAPSTPLPVPTPSSLLVSDTVLGFGSHGTVVYEGSLQGRAVAVKRLLQDFVTIAAREVELLQESDDHPNVIRYYYKESKDGFLYIALELCPASLADVVERPDAFSAIAVAFDPKRALAQVTAGLRHLHMLKIVHRDIKPQNILVSRPKNGQHRMLISDFGLCKKLEVDQTSFLPTAHGALAAGTVGWRAPEILRGDVQLNEQPMDPDDRSSRGSTASTRSAGDGKPTRLTKSVDVFALGCLFYYTLTSGSHPFGDRFEREVNIMKGRVSLAGLEHFGEEGVEAAHLISQMLDQEAKERPDTTTCLIHPFFWTPARRLNFLQDASDRFEIMCREPREVPLVTLETGAFEVVGNDWHSRLDRVFIENLGKFRKYDGRSVQDLLRALRNKKHHYQDMPDHVKRHLGPLPEGFLGYFTRRFPDLILHVHGVIWRCGLARESMFQSYFELAET